MSFYYEAEEINRKLNSMTDIQLQSDYAHKLMDRLQYIKKIEQITGPLIYKF